jgi:hypothetical protein
MLSSLSQFLRIYTFFDFTNYRPSLLIVENDFYLYCLEGMSWPKNFVILFEIPLGIQPYFYLLSFN